MLNPTATSGEIPTINVDGRPMWVFPGGRLFPVIRGGSEDGGDEPGGDTDDQAPANDPAPKPSVDHEADAKKWKALALKHEKAVAELRPAASELQELKNAGKSETERLQMALDEARAEARTNRVSSLKLQVASEKGLPPQLAKFLPDVDNEVDMTAAAEELLEAAGIDVGTHQPTRQPKSGLLTPLRDDDQDTSRDQLIAAMQGRSAI